MRLETSIHQRQELRLKLAPQIIQSIEILQLPTMELQDLVRQEMLENPTIELQEDAERPEDRGETAEGDDGAQAEVLDAPEQDDVPSYEQLDAEFERLEGMESVWKDGPPRGSGIGPDGEDKKLEALQNTAAKPTGLHDYVFEQLVLVLEDEHQREIGEQIIYNLDELTGWLGYRKDDQFIPYSLEELCEAMDHPCRVEEAEQVLRIIQTLEPPGIGARDLTECLLIQLGEGFPLERRIIEKHLDDLKHNRLPKIAKDTGRTMEEVKEAIAFISQLNPHPGSLVSAKPTSHVVPDVICEPVEGGYEVRIEDTYIPRIHVSGRYRRMLQEQRQNRAVRDYIKKKIDHAKWLIDSIEQRQNTLRKISREIVDVQQGYLDKGIDALRPLKMQEIADRVGVHVSTVSRAISDKWMQTPRGVLPLRFFFNGGTTNAEGEEESILAIKQKVRDIVEAEDKRKPLSDEDIAKKLREMGYDIARRTVTKYRKQLGILSSRQRREY